MEQRPTPVKTLVAWWDFDRFCANSNLLWFGDKQPNGNSMAKAYEQHTTKMTFLFGNSVVPTQWLTQWLTAMQWSDLTPMIRQTNVAKVDILSTLMAWDTKWFFIKPESDCVPCNRPTDCCLEDLWLCHLKIPTSWCCSVVDVDAEDHVDATKVCSRFWSWRLVKILNLNFGQDTTAGVWLRCWSKFLVNTLGLQFGRVFEDAL